LLESLKARVDAVREKRDGTVLEALRNDAEEAWAKVTKASQKRG
jgi:hypothetical protein